MSKATSHIQNAHGQICWPVRNLHSGGSIALDTTAPSMLFDPLENQAGGKISQGHILPQESSPVSRQEALARGSLSTI